MKLGTKRRPARGSRGRRRQGLGRQGPGLRGRVLRGLECLERRALLAALPFGAALEDTGEFMLGSVLVTPVFMESVGTVNTATQDVGVEDWTPALIDEALQKIETGLQWWVDTLAEQNSVHSLSFQIDETFADNPVETLYEPINRPSNAYANWTLDFLNEVDFNRTGDVLQDIWDFNHAQRLKFDTNWAFTIFVVNSTLDSNDSFASGGDFQRAFAFSGGRFLVFPSGRPASTVTHETGHMFWALDEYRFSASWHDTRGYYNTQNLNAYDNNPQNPPVQAPSIMANESLLDIAFANHVSPASTLALVGWQDSDGDGIFDVLDVPHSLSGSGFFDTSNLTYRFQGESAVGTLPNQNPSGNGNDITINKISRAEYRIDGVGGWQEAAAFDAYEVDLDLTIDDPRLASGAHTIEIRTVDAATGVSSPVFQGTTQRPTSMTLPGINGSVWNDTDGDGQWDSGELGIPGALVHLVDQNQQPLVLITQVEPDNYASNFQLLNDVVPGIRLSAIGNGVSDASVNSRVGATSSTGSRVFAHFRNGNLVSTEWTPVSRQLKIELDSPTAVISIDAVGVDGNDVGRLDVYDAAGNLLERYTTGRLASGQVETMLIRRDVADIAYAIAHSHDISVVRLDNLRVGPEATTTTDAHGAYSLPGLPAGAYTVQATASGNWLPTEPSPSRTTVTLASGQMLTGVDFGGRSSSSPWQNPANRYDVNNDGIEAPNDALQVINDLNAVGSRTLPPPAPGQQPPPYLDVTGDGIVAPNDVLAIANRLNAIPGQSEGEGSPGQDAPAGDPSAGSGGAASSAGEGEAGWLLTGANRGLDRERFDRADVRAAVRPGRLSAAAEELARLSQFGPGTSRPHPFSRGQLVEHDADGHRAALESLPSADWDTLLDEIAQDIASGWKSVRGASR